MKKIIFFFTVFFTHFSMACIEAKFDKVLCHEEFAGDSELMIIPQVEFNKEYIRFIFKDITIDNLINEPIIDDGIETLLTCDGDKIISTDTFLGESASFTITVNEDSYSFKGHAISAKHKCRTNPSTKVETCGYQVNKVRYSGMCRPLMD